MASDQGERRFGFSLAPSASAPLLAPRPSAMRMDEPGDAMEEDKNFITGIGASGTLLGGRRERKEAPLVIPLEEGWKQKRRPGFDPSQPDASVKHETRGERDGDDLDVEDDGDAALPPLLRNRVPGIDELQDEKAKFLADVLARPESATLDDYDRVPIEKFGEGMLRGMGWRPGKPIGKNSTQVAEVIQYVRRPAGLGLGAKPKKEDPAEKAKKKFIKQGESRKPAPVMALPTGPDGRTRHVRTIDEKLVEQKEDFYDGCTVEIIGGRHEGLRARLLNKRADNSALLLLPSEEKVRVSLQDLRQLEDYELEKEKREKKRRNERDGDRERSKGRSEEQRSSHKRSRSPSDEAERERKRAKTAERDRERQRRESERTRQTWLMRDIRVKIVSKTLRGGRLYSKSAYVVDVLPGARCAIRLDDGGTMFDDIAEEDLETVVPQAGGRVKIVRGEHRGSVGRVMERDRARQKVHVHLEDDLEVATVGFDDCAETH